MGKCAGANIQLRTSTDDLGPCRMLVSTLAVAVFRSGDVHFQGVQQRHTTLPGLVCHRPDRPATLNCGVLRCEGERKLPRSSVQNTFRSFDLVKTRPQPQRRKTSRLTRLRCFNA